MTSLSKNARVAGLLYILSSLFGLVRLIYIPSTLLVSGNAAATTNNIARHELLFRFGPRGLRPNKSKKLAMTKRNLR